MTPKPITLVNSIEVPERFVTIASEWHGGQNCMLYIVCSTGGVTTGTNCPVLDYDGSKDRDRKWYLLLWRYLSADIGVAARAARRTLPYPQDDTDDTDYVVDADLLEEFEKWVDAICERLEGEYNLSDWES